MADKKPPKQFRLTFQAQEETHIPEGGTYEDRIVTQLPRLGFANAYEPNTKAYPGRVKTQDEWAYGHPYGARPCGYFIDETGKYWIQRSSWELKAGVDPSERYNGNNTELITRETIVPDELQPIIIDNIPLEGFKIQHMVARYRGNKLWRILDPRGFELEISSGTFEDLVMTGAVDKGVIIGPCIWKTGKQLVRV